MNFKKTALATAVGATLAISGAAQADGHDVSVYGRINNVVKVSSIDLAGGGDADATNVSDVVSRIGVKASAPINADLTAFGRYEFSTTTDSEGSGIEDTRIAEVGVRGDSFGTLKIGNMWSTYYNMVGTHLDPTVTLGAVLYSTIAALPYRVSNAIQYSNDFGAISFSAEMRIADEDNPDSAVTEKIGASDGTAIGISWAITDGLLVAAVIDQSDEHTGSGGNAAVGDIDRTGVAVKWSPGAFWASLSWGETDEDGLGSIDQTQLHVGAGFGDGWSAFAGYGMIGVSPEVGSFTGDDPVALTVNVTKKFGSSGFRVYYEMVDLSDSNDLVGYEQTTHIAGARIDF
ncbi:porin [Gammaproteobacteria bacterium]|nr:porin [Gammaproteobacteria bacterium]